MRISFLSAVRVLVVSLIALAQDPAAAQEIRAFWADGFSEGFKTPQQIDLLIQRLQTAHCNAVFAQMRKGGDAYYLSRYEPWAADNPQHFDALSYLIEKAHACKPRIQVHAWINTCAVGKTHGNPHHIIAAHPDWKSLSDMGEDYDNEATKIDPGHPDAADWTFRVYVDVVRHYDVDGIHFDFVRYGSTDGKGRWGYNPVSVARFNARYGRSGQPKWEDPLWKQWRRDQVTALVRKVYAMTQAIRPDVAVSAATITWQDGPHDERGMSARKFWLEKSPGMNRVFQDWPSWLKEGILDINCQMSYYQEKNHPDWFRHWIEWGKQNQYGRWVVPGCGAWLNPISDSIKQIEAIQKPGRKGKKAAGALLYSYSGTNAGPDGKEQQSEEFFTALAQASAYAARPPFEKPAEIPDMPWKHKRKGGVKGFVLTTDSLSPVDGSKVTLSGKVRRTQYTDGTGFYAFVSVPDGTYTVTVEGPGYSKRQASVDVKEFDLEPTKTVFLGSAPERFTSNLWPDGPAGTPVHISEAIVVVGTDIFPRNLIIADRDDPTARRRVHLGFEPLLPFVPGDVVAVIGSLRPAEGEQIIEADSVRLVGMRRDGPPTSSTTHLIEGAELLSASLPPASWIRGRVQSVLPDRAILDSSGVRVELMYTGGKLPGVEAPRAFVAVPEVGRRVEVEGIAVTFHTGSGQKGVRLYPVSRENFRVLPLTFTDRAISAAKWFLLPLGVAAVPIWLRRRKRLG